MVEDQGKSNDAIWISVNKTAFTNFSEDGKVAERIPSVRNFTTKQGKELAEVTMPYGMPAVTLPDGSSKQLGGYSFIVSARSIVEDKYNPNYNGIAFPVANKDGEPWQVNLSKETGHRDEASGEWVVDSTDKVSVGAVELKECCAEYRAQRRAAYKEVMAAKEAPAPEPNEKQTETIDEIEKVAEAPSTPGLSDIAQQAKEAAEHVGISAPAKDAQSR